MNSFAVSKLNKEHIQRQFDRSAHRYDRVAQMQAEIVTDLLSFSGLLSGAGNNPIAANSVASIADMGCGTGYGLQALAEQYPQAELTGLDLAESMIEMASERQPRARFLVGDIEYLPFSNAEFDLTWSSSAIQWCDVNQAINELARVTKPGGKLVVSTFSSGTLESWRKLWVKQQDSQRFETSETIESAFISAGLKDIKLKNKTYLQSFTNFRSAVNSIRDLGAGNAEQNRSQGLLSVSQYREIQEKAEQLFDRNGLLVLPYNVVFIVATKGT